MWRHMEPYVRQALEHLCKESPRWRWWRGDDEQQNNPRILCANTEHIDDTHTATHDHFNLNWCSSSSNRFFPCSHSTFERTTTTTTDNPRQESKNIETKRNEMKKKCLNCIRACMVSNKVPIFSCRVYQTHSHRTLTNKANCHCHRYTVFFVFRSASLAHTLCADGRQMANGKNHIFPSNSNGEPHTELMFVARSMQTHHLRVQRLPFDFGFDALNVLPH